MTAEEYSRAERFLARRDPVMAAIIRQHGPCGLAGAQREDPFRAIVEAIVWQQLSGKAAATIFERFLGLFPDHRFPTPDDVSAVTDAHLRAIGFSRQKMGYARLLAMAVIGLIGWAAITALNIASNFYLRRFRLDVDDNLLARKHNTQIRVLVRSADVLLILVTFGTAVLLFSSFFVVMALNGAQRGNQKKLIQWLSLTVLCGLFFIGMQVYEFTHFYHKGMGYGTNLFSSTFFTLTGFHGSHVTVGVIWLATLLVLAIKGKIPPEKSLNLEIAALYWHFVDVVWIVIFTLVYLLHK